MPYLGLFPFLHILEVCEQKNQFRFNALSRAIPISTLEQELGDECSKSKVSMPYLGLFPFLRYALQRRINTAFREPFLRVIHRIF